MPEGSDAGIVIAQGFTMSRDPTSRPANTPLAKDNATTDRPIVDHLTLQEARAVAVIAQRLDRRPPRSRSRSIVKARLLETIQALGCVQLDTISVVARSHETVLWSRLGAYDPALLAELHYPDGVLFEYWAHAAAIVPIEAFAYFREAMAAHRTRYEAPGSWAADNVETLDRVLATIRERGPTAARHFTRPEGPRPEPWAWWGGKPDRRALDHLWSCGDLMVVRRLGFERVYDVTDRVLPDANYREPPSEAAQRRFFVSYALAALGVATARWTADYFRSGSRPYVSPGTAKEELTALADGGHALPIKIEGMSEPAWLDAALLPRLAALRAGKDTPTLTTLLSPFDNLIWYRERTRALFDFDYRLESYTPAARRRYGYYTLPILHRGRLVGRVDPVYDRRARILTLKAVHLEPGVRPSAALAKALARSLWDLTSFLGGGTIAVVAVDPPAFASILHAHLASPADAARGPAPA